MIYLLVLVALVAVAAAAYLATLPPGFEVRRSLLMSPDRQRVFDKVRDLRSWSDWSPWLMHEPGATLTYSGNPDREGGSYSWDGKYIGAGTLTHVRLDAPTRIDQRIAFKRPFKSESEVWWEFSERDGQTEATWGMRGRMPFYLRFMTRMMVPMIEKDYDLGLAMLRGTLDPQAERPQVRFLGETRTAPRTALTIPFSGGMDSMVKAMEEGFPRLMEHVQGQGKSPAGPPFTAYHTVNPKTMHFECDMALPVTEDVAPGSFALKRLGGGRCFSVDVQGSYSFLELAWYSVIAHLRMHKIKQDPSRPSMETYENDSGSVAHSNDIRTRLEVPIR